MYIENFCYKIRHFGKFMIKSVLKTLKIFTINKFDSFITITDNG